MGRWEVGRRMEREREREREIIRKKFKFYLDLKGRLEGKRCVLK